jgi:RNA polymerase sigma factor (sigma-70 family)
MTPLLVRNQSAERAFERLYRAHVRDIYRYALMVTRNPDDAEDVVQTTFMKAFRAFEAGDRPQNARHWLIKIAHNTCRSRVRDAKRRPQEVAFEERLTESVNTHDPDGIQPAELLRALGDLTFNQRAALVMRELEGRSYAEIAQVLELSPSAVETLLFRARRALREQLEGALECGDAELALSRDLDGRLDRAERAQLRAHLRACRECAGLARRQRARRAALGALGPVPLPGSLASWGGGAAAGAGFAAKVAAVVVAGAAAAGAGYEVADAVPGIARGDDPQVVAPRAAVPIASQAESLSAIIAIDFVKAATRAGPRREEPAAGPAGRTETLAAVGTEVGTSVTSLATSTVDTVNSLVTVPNLPAPPALPVEVPAVSVPVQVPTVPEAAAPPVEVPPLQTPELPEVPPLLP